MADKFMLDVRIEIQRVTDGGGYTGERLAVSEQVQLKPGTFLEAMSVLSKFHDLTEKIKTES